MTPSRRAAIILVLSAVWFRGCLFVIDFAKNLIGLAWAYDAIGWMVKVVYPVVLIGGLLVGITQAQPPRWIDWLIVLSGAALAAAIFFFPI